jgi:hypothetical protein
MLPAAKCGRQFFDAIVCARSRSFLSRQCDVSIDACVLKRAEVSQDFQRQTGEQLASSLARERRGSTSSDAATGLQQARQAKKIATRAQTSRRPVSVHSSVLALLFPHAEFHFS